MPNILELKKIITRDSESDILGADLSQIDFYYPVESHLADSSQQLIEFKGRKKVLLSGQQKNSAILYEQNIELVRFPYIFIFPQFSPTAAQNIVDAIREKRIARTEEELLDKTDQLQRQIDEQRYYDDLRIGVESGGEEQSKLEQQLQSVDQLVAKLKEAEAHLEKLQTKSTLASEQRQSLRERILLALRRSLSSPSSVIREAKSGVESQFHNRSPWPLAIASGFFLLAGLAAAWIYADLYIAINTVGVTLIQGLLGFLLIASKYEMSAVQNEQSSGSAYVDVTGILNAMQDPELIRSLNQQGIPDVQDAFVGAASKDAYKLNVDQLKKVIDRELGNKSYDDMLKQLQASNKLRDFMKQTVEVKANSVMSPEIYLKSRRQLDMLRLDINDKQYPRELMADYLAVGFWNQIREVATNHNLDFEELAQESLRQAGFDSELAGAPVDKVREIMLNTLIGLSSKLHKNETKLLPVVVEGEMISAQKDLLSQFRQVIQWNYAN